MSTIKRTAAILFAAAMLGGCGNTTGESGAGTSAGQTAAPAATAAADPAPAADSALKAEDVFKALDDSGLCGAMDTRYFLGNETFGTVCERLYGVPAASLTTAGIMFSGEGAIADEVSVLGGADGLPDLLSKRIEARANDFKGYAPEEEAKAKKGIVFEHKGLAVLVISDSAENIRAVIEEL